MTRAADDPAVEGAFEAYLAGRSVPAGTAGRSDGVLAFTEAVRATAVQPGRPSAALADLFANGLLTDQPSPSARTVLKAGGRARGRIRRRIAMFPALLAKFAGAGAIAKAATGAGIALAAFTGAGVAGVLPQPVENGLTTVADHLGIGSSDESAGSTPTGGGSGVGANDGEAVQSTNENAAGDENATAENVTAEKADGEDANEENVTQEPTGQDGADVPFTCPAQNFGSCVSQRDSGVSGHDVAAAAHARNDARRSTRETTSTTSVVSGDSDDADEDAPSAEESDDSGAGAASNGRSGGHGRSGHGKG